MLNIGTINELISAGRDDEELLGFIWDSFVIFESYHKAVVEDQLNRIVYGGGGLNGAEFRDRSMSLDKARTISHNALIDRVNALNRIAAAEGLEPVYAVEVSKEQPYRRQIADSVFEYIDHIINNRA